MLQYFFKGIVLATLVISSPWFFSRLYGNEWYRGSLLDWMENWSISLGTPAGLKILELGCGPGNFSAELARMGYSVTGVDRSGRMIQRADKFTGVKFIQADALQLPMGNDEFDAVILASLINLLPTRTKLLEEVKRVLRPGGMVSVLFPTPAFNSNKANKISAERNLGHYSAAALSVWAIFGGQLDPDDICNEFTEAGFEIQSIDYYLDGGLASIVAQFKTARTLHG